jgi:hypothetical protein
MSTDRRPFWAADAGEALEGRRRARSRSQRVLQPKPQESPYYGLDERDWAGRTRDLIADYPVPVPDLVDVVLDCWAAIFESTIGRFRIGNDIFLSPQAVGGLLHELIPLEMSVRFPNEWRREETSREKDLVYIPDDRFSTEIKTSSHPTQIFGNRSFAQQVDGGGKKTKSGYYLAVNFDKFPTERVVGDTYRPNLRLIRLGWLDHTDWAGQKEQSGQQAALAPAVEDTHLLQIFAE